MIAHDVSVTADELRTLEHAVAWTRGTYRNYYSSGPDTDSWRVCLSLVSKGLMVGGDPRELIGGMTTFRVTDAGFAFLRKAMP